MTFEREISIALVAGRAVHMTTCLLALGIFVFDRIIVANAGRESLSIIERRWTGISRWLVLLALPIAALSGALWLVCATPFDTDSPLREQVQLFWSATSFGHLWHVRAIFFAAACLTAALAVFLKRGSFLQEGASWLALSATAGLAITIARAGHGGEGTRVHQAADAIHVLISAAWPGGLLPMALLLRRLRREPAPQRWTSTLDVTNRFSLMSIISVVVLSSSGIVNSLGLVDSWKFLFTSTYGRTLLVKAGLLVLMVSLGAINLLILRPRLSTQFDTADETRRQSALNGLRLSVWTEVLFAAAVMAAVGYLGTLEPACCDACCAPS